MYNTRDQKKISAPPSTSGFPAPAANCLTWATSAIAAKKMKVSRVFRAVRSARAANGVASGRLSRFSKGDHRARERPRSCAQETRDKKRKPREDGHVDHEQKCAGHVSFLLWVEMRYSRVHSTTSRAVSKLRRTYAASLVTANVGHERRLEASEACWKASARWKG